MIISVTIQTQDAGEAERALQDLARHIHEAAEKTGKLQPCFGRYATNAGDGRFENRKCPHCKEIVALGDDCACPPPVSVRRQKPLD
jgi:hypothetical protein